MKPLSEQRWTVISSHRGVPSVIGAGQDDGGHICRVDGRVTPMTNQERAALIAAAPELLAALHHSRVCQTCAEGDWTDCEGGRAALAAIAKAEGSAAP